MLQQTPPPHLCPHYLFLLYCEPVPQEPSPLGPIAVLVNAHLFTMADEKDIQPTNAPQMDHDLDHEDHHKLAANRVVNDARNASDKERKMTLWQGIKLYPKAIGWSILISTCIVMEGYDVCLLNNFFGFPQFKEKYGEQLPDGSWEIPAPWQAGLSNGVIVGEIIGLFLNGWISEWIGYRYTVMGCLTLIMGFTAIFFTAQTVVHLLIAEILCGIPWGVFQTLTITYACEVCPVALRGYCKSPHSSCFYQDNILTH